MGFEEKHLNLRTDNRSSLRGFEGRDILHEGWKTFDKSIDFQENHLTNQSTVENRMLQNKCNRGEITVPPGNIFGTKGRRLLKRDEAQKIYGEATERFIAVYQSYEKTGALLQKAKDTGDLEKIDYYSYIYIRDVNNLMHAINLMDQARNNLKHDLKGYSET